jgi:lipoprotein-releasing system permease protein
MEKNRDIAILKTMGASAKSVTFIFMLQGVSIGVVGTAIGATLGYGVAYILDHYKLIHASMDVYQIAYMPFRVILWPDFVLVILTAVIICFLATIIPSRQAARLDPAQALRYE